MSSHESGNAPGDARDDTQRLDPAPPPEAPTAPLASDGVDALWDPGAPEGAPSAGAPEPARGRRRAVRVGTVVWGLVVVACGAVALAAAGGASLDGGTVAIAILGGAGAALVLGSIVTAVRRRDRV